MKNIFRKKSKAFTPVKSAVLNRRKRYLTGFTLIELLVIIAIIGVLATIAMFNYLGAQSRSRDARRITDLNSISQALTIYHDQYGQYAPDPYFFDSSKGVGDGVSTDPNYLPGGSTWAVGGLSSIAVGSPPAIDHLPVDPLNNQVGSNYFWYYYEPVAYQNQFYVYCPSSSCAYILSAKLENSSNSLANVGCEPYAPLQNYCISGGGAMLKWDGSLAPQ